MHGAVLNFSYTVIIPATVSSTQLIIYCYYTSNWEEFNVSIPYNSPSIIILCFVTTAECASCKKLQVASCYVQIITGPTYSAQ